MEWEQLLINFSKAFLIETKWVCFFPVVCSALSLEGPHIQKKAHQEWGKIKNGIIAFCTLTKIISTTCDYWGKISSLDICAHLWNLFKVPQSWVSDPIIKECLLISKLLHLILRTTLSFFSMHLSSLKRWLLSLFKEFMEFHNMGR